MGALGNREKKKNNKNKNKIKGSNSDLSFNLSDIVETQPIHTQFSLETPPDELLGTKLSDDDTQYLGNTLPVDDVQLFGGEFETQVLDFDGETQVLDLFGETQILDDCNPGDSLDGEDEEFGKTQVLVDTQVLSDDDYAKRTDGLVDIGSTPDTSLRKEIVRDAEPLSDAKSNVEQSSGSMIRGFTSVRAASLRASGLAARERALERTNSNLCSTKSDNPLLKHNAVKEGFKLNNIYNQQNSHEDFVKMNESRYKNLQTVGSSTVRKLFTDDEVCDMKQADDGNNHDKDDHRSCAFENGLVGLNYINSEEPGELSQANALDVVNKFLEFNVIEGGSDVVSVEPKRGKAKLVSSARGMKSMAKKATTRSIIMRSGSFCWDDNIEDEGGGEFFQKKKDLFFGNDCQKHSVKKVKMPCCLSSKGRMTSEKIRGKVRTDKKTKLRAGVLSDSKLASKDLRGNNRESSSLRHTSFQRNLIMDLDAEVISTSGKEKTDKEIENNVSDNLDVGIDTQVAADAMVNLCCVGGLTDDNHENRNEGIQGIRKSSDKDKADQGSNMVSDIYRKEAFLSENRVLTRQSKRARTGVDLAELSLTKVKQAKIVKKQVDEQLAEKRSIKAKSGPRKSLRPAPKMTEQTTEIVCALGVPFSADGCVTSLADLRALVKGDAPKHVLPAPIADCTRRSLQLSNARSVNPVTNYRETADDAGSSLVKGAKAGRLCDKVELCKSNPSNALKLGNVNSEDLGQLSTSMLNHPTRKRTRSESHLAGQEASNQGNRRSKKSKTDASYLSPSEARRTSTCVSRFEKKSSGSQEGMMEVKAKHSKAKDGAGNKNPGDGKVMGKHSKEKDGAGSKNRSDKNEIVVCLEASPKDKCKPSVSASTSPGCGTPKNAKSPVCMGDEYHKQLCRRKLVTPCFAKEINNLVTATPETFSVRESRKRRDKVSVRVLFSHHLDPDIIKQQKKILTRLGASEASSMADASHFVTDIFVRTKNMLEAIAFGKPVVTHFWLESCAEASCFIDERNYILRDARKEKEFEFSLPVSLARACHSPLLQGQRILITPNTKPGKDILASLVKAVHGVVVERLGRSLLSDKKLPDELLILSCEEDYELCLPFLEKGACVYSSELLLNGIVTQRLEYERHRLFNDNIKRTRSTMWLKRNLSFVPVNKSK